MKYKSIFCIIKQTYPYDNIKNVFMIMETVFTSDGPRSRICDGRYLDHETAFSALKDKEYHNA